MSAPKGIQDRLSLVALYIEMAFGETILACGSAFLWRHEGTSFLISNWHNFSGRDPTTKTPLSETAGIPDQVRCWLWKNKVSNGKEIAGVISGDFSFPLTDAKGKPLFREHPLGSVIDVAALPVELHGHVAPSFLNEQEFDEEISDQAHTPDYRRARERHRFYGTCARTGTCSQPGAAGGYRKSPYDNFPGNWIQSAA